jgi:hypothetical protein
VTLLKPVKTSVTRSITWCNIQKFAPL